MNDVKKYEQNEFKSLSLDNPILKKSRIKY